MPNQWVETNQLFLENYLAILAKRGYRHKQANRLADERHQKKNKAIKLTDSVKNYISEKLKEYWSPEQIMGRLELDKKIKISTETAYRFVLQDKAVGGALYKYLRHQHKKYLKRYGKNDYRGRIPNRIDIDERPSIVDARTRIGDWELTWLLVKDTKVALPLLLSVRVGYILHYPLPIKPHKMQMTLSINYSLHLNIGSKP